MKTKSKYIKKTHLVKVVYSFSSTLTDADEKCKDKNFVNWFVNTEKINTEFYPDGFDDDSYADILCSWYEYLYPGKEMDYAWNYWWGREDEECYIYIKERVNNEA